MERRGQAFGGPKPWVRDIVFTTGAAVTIGFLGPYGSYDEPLEARMIRSFALGFAGSLWLWPSMRLVLRVGQRAGLPYLFTMVVGLVVLAVPVSLVSFFVSRLLGPGGPSEDPVRLYLSVLAMVLPIGLGYLHVDRWLDRQAEPQVAEPGAPPKLLTRLPAHLGRDVVALQAEDHYVRVHTSVGSALLLMRLADAIAELEGVEGLRVHRSWWVARRAVAAARPEGRRAVLTLSNGVEAPVTREGVPEIRRSGWL